ncbi:MAG TPA: RluA family pseudouridine synthase [Ramlibacter sp.]|nr:RluA family pseudouridine synthase [Ramlibacter sp.]
MAELSRQAALADELAVLHADEHLLVLNKPSGLLCVPGRGVDKQDCLSARVRAVYPDALVVHRLDMGTSGLWLMARGTRMQRLLGDAFAQRRVGKRYVAVVDGWLPPAASGAEEWSLIDLPIAADWPNRPLRVIDAQRGKPSQTRWRTLSHDAGANTTRVELEPLTGRSHQLRLHLRSLGHPILGDGWYAPPEVHARSDRLLLHASALQFVHPATGQAQAFQSAVPF